MLEGITIARNNVQGELARQGLNKFGSTPSANTSQFDPIWDAAGAYTFMTAASTLAISSSDDGDDQVYEIQGLDTDYNLQSKSVTCTGYIPATIDGTWLRVFRVKNTGSTNNAGSIYISDGDSWTAGVPDTASNIKAKIQIGNNQTLMAIYTVPAGYTAYLHQWDSTCGKGEDVSLKLLVRKPGGVFQVKDKQFLYENGLLRQFYPPIAITEKSDVVLSVMMVSNTSREVDGGFDMILEANSYIGE